MKRSGMVRGVQPQDTILYKCSHHIRSKRDPLITRVLTPLVCPKYTIKNKGNANFFTSKPACSRIRRGPNVKGLFKTKLTYGK